MILVLNLLKITSFNNNAMLKKIIRYLLPFINNLEYSNFLIRINTLINEPQTISRSKCFFSSQVLKFDTTRWMG